MIKYIVPFIILALIPIALHAQTPTTHKVTQVVDGGTIVLDNGQVVKLIGVEDPPFPKNGKNHSPAESWAKRSQEFLSGLVMGREVWLESDPHAPSSQGAQWAYVYFKLENAQAIGGGGLKPLLTSGTYLANRLMIQYGFATAGAPFKFKYLAQFRQLEQNARMQQTGLWQSNF